MLTGMCQSRAIASQSSVLSLRPLYCLTLKMMGSQILRSMPGSDVGVRVGVDPPPCCTMTRGPP